MTRRRGLIVGGVALVVVLLLAGVAGVVTVTQVKRRNSGSGQPTPGAAVTAFLTATYQDGNPTRAGDYVCHAARSLPKLRTKVAELTTFREQVKVPAVYTWTPPAVETQAKDTATVTVTVRLTTDDDRVAEQRLRVTTVRAQGWLVCDVASVA